MLADRHKFVALVHALYCRSPLSVPSRASIWEDHHVMAMSLISLDMDARRSLLRFPDVFRSSFLAGSLVLALRISACNARELHVDEGSPALCAREKPVCTDDIDSLVTILCLHLSHDAVNMVFDGELGKVQVGGNLFVTEALRNESSKFALPVSETKLDAILSRGNSDFRPQLSRYELEEELAELRRTDGFSLRNPADRFNHLSSGCVLQYVTANARAYQSQGPRPSRRRRP
jgi:hypothetical protein